MKADGFALERPTSRFSASKSATNRWWSWCREPTKRRSCSSGKNNERRRSIRHPALAGNELAAAGIPVAAAAGNRQHHRQQQQNARCYHAGNLIQFAKTATLKHIAAGENVIEE